MNYALLRPEYLPTRTFRLFFALSLPVLAWAGSNSAQAQPGNVDAIVVTGNREQQAEIAAEQAKLVTLRPLGDNPLPRHYAPICVRVFGIDPAYGEVIAEQVTDNARTLKLPVGGKDCQANVWIGFTRSSQAEVGKLRKQLPEMFGTLSKVDVERIFRGSGAAQAWHSTELRNADGRPMIMMELDTLRKEPVAVNQLYQGGRLVSPVRSDINGSIVVFDAARANGRTVQQLADYATMRILAPVQDFDKAPEGGAPTILQLFAEGASPVDGLTEFDWAYLAAFYKLDRGARASAVHDATRKAMLDGTGQRLREKSGEQ
jgi:hypothetical protein